MEAWSEELASGALDYYFVKAISEAGLELITLPVSPLTSIMTSVPGILIDPLGAVATGAVYKYVFKRKNTLLTPTALSGKTQLQKNGAMLGVIVSNFVSSIPPINVVPFVNSVSIVGGMAIGKNLRK
jgi:uncharacterized protein YqgC (DUF456 family)